MSFRIGLVSGSARVVRVGPQIATFSAVSIEFDVIDIGTLKLPAHYDEPGIPKQVANMPDDYVHEHTGTWSKRIVSLDTFVFVTPQYNWGVSAALKTVIDYLFREWYSKPFMVVSYGGHGGGHAAAALQLILSGAICLSSPSHHVLKAAAKGKDLGERMGQQVGRYCDSMAAGCRAIAGVEAVYQSCCF